MYLLARGWGIQPGAFWDMTPAEFLLEWEFHNPGDAPGQTYAGSLTEADVRRLMAWDEETVNA